MKQHFALVFESSGEKEGKFPSLPSKRNRRNGANGATRTPGHVLFTETTCPLFNNTLI